LRSKPCFKAIAAAINAAKGKFETTIAAFSVQSNHMHLIVESVDERKLAAAMKGLSVRIAKAVNRATGKEGQVVDSRYHTRYLRSPTEVKHAVRYVLRNHTKHTGVRGIDPCGSLAHPELVTPPRTWLLNRAAPS
jgi:REP element-mobilizing transposase RayT